MLWFFPLHTYNLHYTIVNRKAVMLWDWLCPKIFVFPFPSSSISAFSHVTGSFSTLKSYTSFPPNTPGFPLRLSLGGWYCNAVFHLLKRAWNGTLAHFDSCPFAALCLSGRQCSVHVCGLSERSPGKLREDRGLVRLHILSGTDTKYSTEAFKNAAQILLIHANSCHGLLFQSFVFFKQIFLSNIGINLVQS